VGAKHPAAAASASAGPSRQGARQASGIGPVRAARHGRRRGAPWSAGGTTLLQARTANEVLKAQLHKIELAQRKGELVDRAQAVSHVFKLARTERDAWLNWPARISAQMAARLNVDAHALHVALDAAVREHLQELGELRPSVD
jgi:hypothetical protein